ncbi:MAG: MBL fold metallo-hydrolase [Comamonas sp.]
MDSAACASHERVRASADLRYPFEPPKADGSLVEVAPGVMWARMPMPMTLDHINVYLLRDGNGWAVVDTGLGIPSTHALWEKIFGELLQGQPMTRLICTHCHYDHAGAAHWIQKRFGVPLLMTFGEYMMMRGVMGPPPDPLPAAHLEFYQRAGVDEALMERMFTAMRKDPFMPKAPEDYQRIRAGQVLHIGERRWRVVLGEGHSPEHACLYDEEGKLLLAGDQLLPRITSNVMVSPMEPEGNPLQDWMASMQRLAALDEGTLVLPSHQGVFYGVRERAQEVIAHHEAQYRLIESYLERVSCASALEIMKAQFPKLRGAVDHLMALGETIAHLNLLMYAGTLRRERRTGKIDSYALA